MQLELHEDEVPEFEETLAARATRLAVGLTASVLGPPVVVHLGVGAARPRTAHGPEVLGAREEDDALGRLSHLHPVPVRDFVLAEAELGIPGEDADPETLGIELQMLEHELPRELDRALLEVLAEREVAEHLEERQMRAVEADLVDVRRTEALLHGREQWRGRGVAAEEVRHERLHPGRRQQRRAVVRPRDERSRGPKRMVLGLEKGTEPRAQLIRRAHPEIVGPA